MRNSLSEADRASKSLSRALGVTIRVLPIVVIVEAASIMRRGSSLSRPDVVSAAELLRHLKRGRRTLSPEQIRSVVDVAARPQTWSAQQSPALEHTLLQEFAALQSEEEHARLIRIAWIGLATLLALAFVLPSILSSRLFAAFFP